MAPLFQTLGLLPALAIAACSEPVFYPALVDCTRHSIRVTEDRLVGIEDMEALDAHTLILSAYNRRDINDSPKGLFALDIRSQGATWHAQRITAEADTLLPHGIALSKDKTSLYAVDRSARPYPQLVRYNLNKEQEAPDNKSIILSITAWKNDFPFPCNLNDLAIREDGSVLFTNDRASCSWAGKVMDNIFARENGSVWNVAPNGDAALLAGGLAFPNGVAESGEAVLVAETRGASLYNVATGTPQPLAGAPDNITLTDSGEIWIAAFPSLVRYALDRAGITGEGNGSLVIRAMPAPQAFALPDYSGATTALRLEDRLYISGAYTDTLLTCAVPDGS